VTKFELYFYAFQNSIPLCNVSKTHIKYVSQNCVEMQRVHRMGKVAVVVQGFTKPRLQVLEAMSKFCGTCVWNFLYDSLLTPMFLRLLQDYMKVRGPH